MEKSPSMIDSKIIKDEKRQSMNIVLLMRLRTTK